MCGVVTEEFNIFSMGATANTLFVKARLGNNVLSDNNIQYLYKAIIDFQSKKIY